jgi:hypothetical protein
LAIQGKFLVSAEPYEELKGEVTERVMTGRDPMQVEVVDGIHNLDQVEISCPMPLIRFFPIFEGELGELKFLWSGFLFSGRVAFGFGSGAISCGIAVNTEGFLESRFSLLADFGKRATSGKPRHRGDKEYGQ